MTPYNSNRPGTTQPGDGKGRPGTRNMDRIKMLIAVGAVAGTLGGWGVLAQQNTDAPQAEATSVTETSTPVSSATATATYAAESTATPTAQMTATDTATAASTNTPGSTLIANSTATATASPTAE